MAKRKPQYDPAPPPPPEQPQVIPSVEHVIDRAQATGLPPVEAIQSVMRDIDLEQAS